MPQRANRFATAVVAGSAVGIVAGLLGVLAGGFAWALVFLGPFISGALVVWSDLADGPKPATTAAIKGAAAGLLSGILCMMALPAYLAIWQEVSLLTVYNPVYWLSHEAEAEVSEEIGSRAGWCAILGSMFTAACMIEGALSGWLASFVPRAETVKPRPRGSLRS